MRLPGIVEIGCLNGQDDLYTILDADFMICLMNEGWTVSWSKRTGFKHIKQLVWLYEIIGMLYSLKQLN